MARVKGNVFAVSLVLEKRDGLQMRSMHTLQHITARSRAEAVGFAVERAAADHSGFAVVSSLGQESPRRRKEDRERQRKAD